MKMSVAVKKEAKVAGHVEHSARGEWRNRGNQLRELAL